MNEIEKLELEIKELHNQRGKLQEAAALCTDDIKARESSHARLKFGVEIGSIVSARGIDFQVTSIGPLYSRGKPTVYGSKKLKGGGFHARPQYIGDDWTLVL